MADNQQQDQVQPQDWGDSAFTPMKPKAGPASAMPAPQQDQQPGNVPTNVPNLKLPSAAKGQDWGDTPFTPMTKQGQSDALKRLETQAKADQPVEPNAAKRYMSGLYATTLGPMAGIGRELMEKNGDLIAQAAADYRAGNHLRAFTKLAALAVPISPENPEVQVSSKIVQGAIKSMNDEWSKGIDLGHQGRYSEAAGHLLASVIPFMGPAAAHAGERMGEGDIAGGLGETTGLVGSTVGLKGAGKAVGAVSKAAGKVMEVATPGGLREALETAGETRTAARAAEAGVEKTGVAGKIVQEADKKQLSAATRGLGMIDTSGVKTYADLTKAVDQVIKEKAAQVDKALEPSSMAPPPVFKLSDLDKQIPVEGGTPRTVNPVRDALAQLRDFYEKTNDDPEAARIEGLQNKFEKFGVSIKDMNDIAREHGTELSAFNPSTNELASGLGRQAAENTRSGVKDVVHQFTDSKTQATDAQISDLITLKGLTKDMEGQVTRLEQKFQEAGWGQRLARFVKKTGVGAAGGLVAGRLVGLGPTGGAIAGGLLNLVIENMLEKTGTLNATKLQARLPGLLKEFRRLNELAPDKALDGLKKLVSTTDSDKEPEPPEGGGGGGSPKAGTPEAEPEIELMEPEGARTGGSGESAASQEAINRVQAESSRGVKRFRVDTRSGNRVPLIGVDAIDAKPGPYDVIIMRDKNGYEEVLDRGNKAA